MKYVLLFCLFVAMPAHGQARARAIAYLGQATTEPFKGANTIVLHTADSAAAAYGHLTRVLLAGGFALDRTDPAVGQVDTAPCQVGGLSLRASFRFIVVPASGGASIAVQGSYHAAASPRGRATIRPAIGNVGIPGSPPQLAWAAMIRACQLYPQATLAYLDTHKAPK